MLTEGSLCERGPRLADRKMIEKMAEMSSEGEKKEKKIFSMCKPTALAEREGVGIIQAHVASGTEIKSWLCFGNMFHLRISVGFHRAKLPTRQRVVAFS